MKISDACIKRPVLAVVLSLVLVMMSLISLQYLDVRFFPDFQAPKIFITAAYPGASPSMVETSITTPLESAISDVPGIDHIESISGRGESDITVTLQDGVDVDVTGDKIRSAVFGALGDLPDDMLTPVVQVGKGDIELLDIAFSDPHKNLNQIRDYLNRFVINRLREVPGVGDIEINGANPYAMRVWLEPEKMASLGISVDQVQQALENSNLELPVGEIKSGNMNFPVTADTKLSSANAFKQIVINNVNGRLVRMGDIAKVSLGADDSQQEITTINGKPAVALSITNSSGASPITVAKALKQKLAEIKPVLPEGMQMRSFFDLSTFLNASVNEVYFALFFSVLCVIIAIFIFLGSWRASLIPLATVPVCIISAFGVMALLHFSINVITLLALVLAIGLVVDDAIVMLENIHRHIQQGATPMQAAFKGSRQIAFAVIGMTICLAAVYAPVGLIQGMTAIIFREFAFTLSGAVIISGFVALTLTPMMCSRIMDKNMDNGRYARGLEKVLERLKNGYQKILRLALKLRLVVVIFAVLIAISGYGIIKILPSEFMPPEDMGILFAMLQPPTGASLDAIENQANQVSNILKSKPYISTWADDLSDGPDAWNSVFIGLKPYNKRKLSANDIVTELNTEISNTPGLDAFIFAPSPFSGTSHNDLELYIMSSGSYLQLYHLMNQLTTELSKYKGVNNVDTNMKFNSQQYSAKVNRQLANALNVNVADIDDALSVLLGGNDTTYFNLHDYRYHVRLQANQEDLRSPSDIGKFYVSNATGKMISLSNLVTMQPTVEQAQLPHYSHLRAAKLSAQLSDGYSLGQVMHYLDSNLPKLLPKNASYAYSGKAERLQKSRRSMGIIFGLGLVFIYLVLAALFESFIDPLIVLLVVPLTIVGALAFLKLIGGSLNIYTEIGLVTLIGLIAKHGILITQFANELRQQGVALNEAIIKAAGIRLRPILMTTTAMIFGALPLILATGASSNSRRQIGSVIISGLLFGTICSLIIVPVAYRYFAKIKRKPKQIS